MTESDAMTAPDGATELESGCGLGATLSAAYSDALAGVYDDVYPSTPDLDDVGHLLRGLSGKDNARVLEVGVGTGRVALRLADQGFRVHGIDTSAQMLAQLAAKDPENRVARTQGDVTSLEAHDAFDVVLAPFNVLCCAMAVDEQIAMMHAISRLTTRDGHVVIETFDPSDFHVQRGNDVTTYPLGDRGVMLETVSILPASQNMMVQNTLFTDGNPPTCATSIMRYLWPAELDLLGAIAGLELTARYAGWNEQPFTGGDSRSMCVSVFRPLS